MVHPPGLTHPRHQEWGLPHCYCVLLRQSSCATDRQSLRVVDGGTDCKTRGSGVADLAVGLTIVVVYVCGRRVVVFVVACNAIKKNGSPVPTAPQELLSFGAFIA